MLLECRTVKKTSRTLNSKKIKSNSVTQFSQKSNEQLKSDVFSRRLKTDQNQRVNTSGSHRRRLTHCILHACVGLYNVYTRWGGPSGIEAYPWGLLLPSVLWYCWLGHL